MKPIQISAGALQYNSVSNGCRVGLSSLENNYVNSSKVDTFVGVGCPGAFEGDSLLIKCFADHGEDIIDYFEERDNYHPARKSIGYRLAIESYNDYECGAILASQLTGDDKISTSLGRNYINWIINQSDQQPGDRLELNEFSIIYGTQGYQFNNDNDYVVTEDDALAIRDGIISSNKDSKAFHLRHSELPKDEEVKDAIKKSLE